MKETDRKRTDTLQGPRAVNVRPCWFPLVCLGCFGGWVSPHNPKVVGSNPTPATNQDEGLAAKTASPFVFLSENYPNSTSWILKLGAGIAANDWWAGSYRRCAFTCSQPPGCEQPKTTRRDGVPDFRPQSTSATLSGCELKVGQQPSRLKTRSPQSSTPSVASDRHESEASLGNEHRIFSPGPPAFQVPDPILLCTSEPSCCDELCDGVGLCYPASDPEPPRRRPCSGSWPRILRYVRGVSKQTRRSLSEGWATLAYKKECRKGTIDMHRGRTTTPSCGRPKRVLFSTVLPWFALRPL
jgi:hypothetical protein